MDRRSAKSTFVRVIDAFLGLLAASLVYVLVILGDTLRIYLRGDSHATENAVRHVEPALAGYFLFSGWGWLMVGLPFALFVPTAFIQQRGWPMRVLIGLAAGPIALLFVFFGLVGTRMFSFHAFTTIGPAWAIASAISVIAFAVYAWLLDRQAGVRPGQSGTSSPTRS
jgi:hypothetical protein